MSHTRTMTPLAGLPVPARLKLGGFVVATARAAWERWQQQAQLRAQHVAIRGLDRRTRQDLGLYVGDEPWGRDRPLSSDYERLRW